MTGATTEDAFLGGRLVLHQPARGYRAGTDPVLLAAAVPATPGQSVLELGCGVGTAALCLMARVPGLDVTGVELQPDYADLARRNAARNALPLGVVTADLARLPDDLRQRAFDHVIANPPYFDPARSLPARDDGKATAFAGDTPLAVWIDTALRRLAPGGRLVIGGEPWVDDTGLSPAVNSDGIALSPDGEHIYYQALTGRTLYRVPTGPIREVLRPSRDPESPWFGASVFDLDELVENLGTTFATDAMIMDKNGVLYFTALERDAITARLPTGELTMVTSDERLVWPDSFCIHNGLLYVTTARINEVGLRNDAGPEAEGPFTVLRVPLLDPQVDE